MNNSVLIQKWQDRAIIKFYLSVSDQLVDVEKSRCASVKLPINRRYRKDTASTPEESVLTR